ncbi:MAG: tail fiber domain-containing protein [Candidatus Gracilibacteria bacterium]|nr:tail fiber domain-containing protein [Candidatus Gracilibacteria bacterium]MDD2908888.1 tail fiber domain-containing protein [Candidatus Gracilibacteria bacterium]
MKAIKKPIYSAIVFFSTLGVLTMGYATYTALTPVNTGDKLESGSWNTMITNLEDLNSRALSVSGTNLYYKLGTDDNTYNLGIGTNKPLRKLSIRGGGMSFQDPDGANRSIHWGDENTNIFPIVIAGNGKNGSESLMFLTNTFGNAGIERMTITSAGKVGIGTTLPSYQLQLSTDSAAKPGTSTWTIASDRRLKTNISDFNDGLNVINDINPVWFNYNGKAGLPTDKKYVGIIAQDIQKIAPYTVSTYKAKLNPEDKTDTELLNFNESALNFVIINAIKEQQKELEEMKKENEELKLRIEKIENR